MAGTNDRKFEQYMEGDQQAPAVEEEQPVNNLPYDEKDDDRSFLMDLLNYLQDELTNARAVPLTNNRMINAQMCIDIITDIRNNLPLAIQYSEQVLRERDRMLHSAEQAAANKIASAEVRANAALDDAQERADRIVSDAQQHADNIVKDAEVRARAMIEQSTIKREAQRQADEILRNASNEAYERRQQAADYCDKLLRDVEDTLQTAYDEVRRNRQALGQNRMDIQ